jgi:hypothetical protein
MSTAERIGMGLVGIGMATTLVLPGRQTPRVLQALFSGVQGLFRTAITGQR